MTTTEQALLSDEVVLAPVSPDSLSVVPAVGRSRLRLALVAVDAVAAMAAWTAALAATEGFEIEGARHRGLILASTALLLTLVTISTLASQRLYLARVCAIRSVEIVRLGRTAATAGLAALVIPRLLPIEIGTTAAAAGTVATFLLLLFVRGLYRHWLQMGRRDGRYLRSMVIVGSNEEAYDLYKLLKDHPELGFRAAGIVGDRGDMLAYEYLVPYLGSLEDARDAVRRSGANGVIVAASAMPSTQLNALIRGFLREGLHVHLSSGLRGIDHRRLRSQPLAHEPLFYLEPMQLAPWQVKCKRVIDVTVAAVGGLLFAAPLVLAAAVAIKLQDRGPVFYRQQRVGRNGVAFTIIKLRTMAPNADRLYHDLAESRAGRDGPLIKLADDPRRTTVGKFLERLSIDELPQLWNVLTGEMSLVGPRPAQQLEVDAFDEELLNRLSVRPGITGLWQVEARDNPSFAAYRRFDLFYLENWTVSLDLAILVATVQRVLLRGVELIISRKGEMAASVVVVPPARISLVD